jgi:hypothetical protein
MAILSALLSLVMRELSTIVQAIFGWSITALFGKLPSKKQTGLSVALAFSIVWPLLLLGCFLPGAAAWTIALVPIHKWLGDLALRIIWISLAVLVPIAVGAITRWITPQDKLRGGLAFTLLGGYVLAVAYFAAFVITALTVPIVKVMSAVHKWEDCHVYVQPKEGRYSAVLDALAKACDRVGVRVVREDVPRPMALASTIVQKLAQPFLEPIVAVRPQRLRGKGLEIYLYPADLLLRGDPHTASHVRAAMTRTNLEEDAYLVTEPEAQKLQDEIQKLWSTQGEQGKGSERGETKEPESLGSASSLLQDLSRRLDRAPIPFDEWTTLEAALRRFERSLSAEPDLLAAGSDDESGAFVRRASTDGTAASASANFAPRAESIHARSER